MVAGVRTAKTRAGPRARPGDAQLEQVYSQLEHLPHRHAPRPKNLRGSPRIGEFW